MAYKIDVRKRAAKALAAIPHDRRKHVGKTITELAENPRPRGCVALSGQWKGFWRVRQGMYRVIYTINDAIVTVVVVDVVDRDDAYR